MALSRTGGSDGDANLFAQQGTVDWTALGRMTYTTSIEVLARMSSAGIESLTVAFGQAMCAKILIGAHGEKVLMNSLNNLKAFSSFGDIVWFEVGVRHILRDIVQTSEGASLVALSAALSEAFTTQTAALVLYEMAKFLRASSDLSPSLAQWEALVKCCSCIFRETTFGLTVQKLVSLGAFSQRDPWSMGDPGHPKDLARVILALGQITRGDLKQVTVQGGASCCWLATFASSILGIRVEVHSDAILLY